MNERRSKKITKEKYDIIKLNFVLEYAKVKRGCNQKKKKTLKYNFLVFFFFGLTGCYKPPVLGKGAFPWWETTPCSQAKHHHTIRMCTLIE